jgi:hypothetical protein
MSTGKTEKNEDVLALETRKVKALEKIANSLDSLTVWFEEIDKEEWSNRLQYYLSEFHTKFVKEETSEEQAVNVIKPIKKK